MLKYYEIITHSGKAAVVLAPSEERAKRIMVLEAVVSSENEIKSVDYVGILQDKEQLICRIRN